LKGIELADAGKPVIEVTFELNTNGILIVRATDVKTHVQEEITINSEEKLTDEQVQEAKGRAKEESFIGGNPCNILEALMDGLKVALENSGEDGDLQGTNLLKNELKNMEKWLAKNKNPSGDVCEEQILDLRKKFASFLNVNRNTGDDSL
jgi:molecular chaperone DnaK (HSP70)